jgi:hypothetical protein
MNPPLGFRPRILAAAVLVLAAAAPVSAQVDPLLFLKTAPPNVILVVDTANRMQRDAPTNPATVATSQATSHYYDPFVYTKEMLNPIWQQSIGVTNANTNTNYRRRYNNLTYTSSNGDRFTASKIETVGDRTPQLFSLFEAGTRLSVARAALYQAVDENRTVARFSLVKMRQTTPAAATKSNAGPVAVADINQQISESGSLLGRWPISQPTVGGTSNGDSNNSGVYLAQAGVPLKTDIQTNADVITILARNPRTAGGLLPAGNDDEDDVDAPVKLMLDDARAEAARLIALNADPTCRNTVVVLVVGGGEGTTSNLTNAALATAAANFLNVGGRRVPVYVIAIAPPTSDVPGLQAIAAKTGGQYFEIAKWQIDAVMGSPKQIELSADPARPGTIVVPDAVKAVNIAIQHAFQNSADFNTLPTAYPPIGKITEHQVTSPIIGSVNLDGARDINGVALVPDSATILDKAGVKIPLRSNLLVTAGFSLPGFDGVLRGFRVYKPVADGSKASGYKFVSDGTPLWKACVPGPGCLAAPDVSRRNLYTTLPNGTMVAFHADNAAVLAPLMNLTTVDDAKNVINGVRALPFGAVVSSTPAIMNPPSLDPPPDADYPAFRTDNEKRRSIVWVGTNNGTLEAIDSRFGVEVWGFVPMNLLPKLRTLLDGQAVGSFAHFVDSSPKISDVKYDDKWHTSLIVGEGPGGTYYHSFDVTLADMASALGGSESDATASVDQLLTYFSNPGRITLNWAFPSLTKFNPTLAPYGELDASASAVEKTVGQTWSDPAVGQIVGPLGPYAVLLGSGFLPYSVQQQPNRGGTVAGTTFYIVDAKTGTLLASKDVGTDGVNEMNDNCAIQNGAAGCQKSKNALMSDPVATGPTDSRYVTRTYIGDLDGNIWRFDFSLSGGVVGISATTKLYSAGADQPIFNSMATVTVGTRQYVFVGTGSDLLPQTDKNTIYRLLGVLDNGATGAKTFEKLLQKTVSGTTITTDERVTAFPAVAGDIVFFTTTVLNALCSAPDARLYAFTFIGGPAYDNTGDNVVRSGQDTPLVRTIAGQRATAPFIVDQHVVFGAGGSNVQMFGDSTDYNNGIGQAGVRILSWREVR